MFPLVLASCSLAAPLVPTPAQSPAPHARPRFARPDLYAATDARTLAIHAVPPGFVSGLAPHGGQRLRAFGDRVYVVDAVGGTIARIQRATGVSEVLDFGPASEPQDVLALGPRAFVTLRHEPELRHVDLVTGVVRASVDLTPLARPGESLELRTMIRDGDVLLVQVKLVGGLAHGDPYDDRGVLAVVDPLGEVLLDADPLEPGVQGIALAGAPPQLDMQIVAATRTLFVSTTDGYLDGRGGIEMVDLDAWRSIGFALHEKVIADLGGFVMTAPDAGFFVFHTDLLASTHLKPFTIGGGPPAGPEMIVFFDVVDELAYDPRSERLYLPGRYASPVIHVFDARTKEPVGDGMLDVPGTVHDVLVPPR